MKKLLITSALAFVISTPAAFAEGQAIGQDPAALARTKCGNNGGGNGGEKLTLKFKCLKNFLDSEDHERDVDPGATGS